LKKVTDPESQIGNFAAVKAARPIRLNKDKNDVQIPIYFNKLLYHVTITKQHIVRDYRNCIYSRISAGTSDDVGRIECLGIMTAHGEITREVFELLILGKPAQFMLDAELF